jgi:hypothetical protein
MGPRIAILHSKDVFEERQWELQTEESSGRTIELDFSPSPNSAIGPATARPNDLVYFGLDNWKEMSVRFYPKNRINVRHEAGRGRFLVAVKVEGAMG